VAASYPLFSPILFRIFLKNQQRIWPHSPAEGQRAPSRQAFHHTLSPAALPDAHAEVLRRRRQRYKYVSVVERPQQCSDQQLEIAEGLSPRGLTYLCTEKAGYIDSAPLYICRVVHFLLRQRRGAGLGELQRARGRNKYFATAPTHTSLVLHRVRSSKLERSEKQLSFPVRKTRARATCISLFPCQTTTRSFLRFFHSSGPFSPACSPPPSCFFA
jgi:hypothetical protein